MRRIVAWSLIEWMERDWRINKSRGNQQAHSCLSLQTKKTIFATQYSSPINAHIYLSVCYHPSEKKTWIMNLTVAVCVAMTRCRAATSDPRLETAVGIIPEESISCAVGRRLGSDSSKRFTTVASSGRASTKDDGNRALPLRVRSLRAWRTWWVEKI